MPSPQDQFTTICCCTPFASAGICAALQLLFAIIGLSNSILVIRRGDAWHKGISIIGDQSSVIPLPAPSAMMPISGGSPPLMMRNPFETADSLDEKDDGNDDDVIRRRLSSAWLELSMAWYCGFTVLWILSVMASCLSFRFYRPVLVAPVIATLFAGIPLHLLVIGSLITRLHFFDKDHSIAVSGGALSTTKDADSGYGYEQLMLTFVCGSIIVITLMSLVFIRLTVKYYSFLQQRYSTPQKVFPAMDDK